MKEINKFVIGIKPSQKMFRISSIAGLIADEVLATRGKKQITDEYYKEVSRNTEQGYLRLRNKELGNILQIDLENIIFIKDYYSLDTHFNANKVFEEFKIIWKAINDILKLKAIRRIGISAEHQIEINDNNATKKLIKSLTSIPSPDHPAKFLLRFEERAITKEGAMPDFKKDDFINIIYDYYDSENDSENPKENHINANIDVQRYYSPLFEGNVADEVVKVKHIFDQKKNKFEISLKQKGLM